MNPRIREFAKQALDYANSCEAEAWDGAYERKFSELIVKECIGVPYAMWDQAELNADVAVKIEHRIRDHFGMEE